MSLQLGYPVPSAPPMASQDVHYYVNIAVEERGDLIQAIGEASAAQRSEEQARIVGIVSGTELRNPELLRTIPVPEESGETVQANGEASVPAKSEEELATSRIVGVVSGMELRNPEQPRAVLVPDPVPGISEASAAARSEEQLATATARIVGVVSGMKLRNPELLRAVPAWVVLRQLGQVLRDTSSDPAKLYSLSEQVPFIKEFWSHSWHGSRFMKIWLLLVLKNGCPAVCVGILVAFLAAFLSYLDILPGWYKVHYSGEFKHSPWAMVSGVVASLVTLLLWRPGGPVFLDRVCIHQGDEVLKSQAILQLGAFLKSSRTLVVVWDPTYLSRRPGFSSTLLWQF